MVQVIVDMGSLRGLIEGGVNANLGEGWEIFGNILKSFATDWIHFGGI